MPNYLIPKWKQIDEELEWLKQSLARKEKDGRLFPWEKEWYLKEIKKLKQKIYDAKIEGG